MEQSEDQHPAIVLRPSNLPLRLLLDARWDDIHGGVYYPIVHVQQQSWNDDTTFSWIYLSIDDFSLRGDTIIVHPEQLLLIDYEMNGANFSFRVRLSSVGFQTDWVRLPESIRFYRDDKPGIPRQPRALKLLR